MKKVFLLLVLLLAGQVAALTCKDGSKVDSLLECKISKQSLPVPSVYWFRVADFPASINVVGDKRSASMRGHRLIWDSKTNEAFLSLGSAAKNAWSREILNLPENESDKLVYVRAYYALNLTGDERDKKTLASYTREPKQQLAELAEMLKIKSPSDWVKEYTNSVPVSISNKSIIIRTEVDNSVNLTVTFKNKKGGTVIMYLHPVYNLPILVEENDGKSVRKYKYTIGNTAKKAGKRVPLSDAAVSLASERIIASESEWNRYLTFIGKG